ncbi:unnamed protein product [Cylicocyclus nassatus]|uniref:ShKT domain-containing protein n=1 Tax=Cylicocyclus nassatus TaxID=53992 RepID=A0AA36DUE9_CYLNA|nr:unnamed protein product [Cylicocyclus nassatus]
MLFLATVLGQLAVVISLDCSTAPTEALRIVCQQIARWDDSARKAPPPTSVMPPAIAGKTQLAAEFAPIASNMYQCMDIACLCVFFRGTGGTSCTVQGRPLRKALRKEYRQLSDNERARLHAAFRTMKNNGEYDRLATIHSQFSGSGGAHSGPAFLPWHREYMKRVEIAIRQVDPDLALPYWDSTLEENMPNSKDSILWTNEFMGESAGGSVNGGSFREWRTLEARPNIRREVGARGKCFSEDEIQFTLRQTDINQVLAFSAPRPGCPSQPNYNVLEYTHGNAHIYVGGEMFDTQTSANDPIFFMHHSFVDCIWEMFRQTRQTRADRERAYPVNNELCASQHHFGSTSMRPFAPMKNTDGLSNMYTDNLYSYAPRPSCSMGNDCGSKYLYCDRSHGQPRCASKIKPGGSCAGLNNGENACYNGRCMNGRCVVAAAQQATTPPPIAPAKPVVVVQQTCFNEHECCSHWSRTGECPKNRAYMSEWCKASCLVCQPTYDLNNATLGNCNSIMCFNEDICCPYWAYVGGCITNPDFMLCQCRVSCEQCTPDYFYGECEDYHRDCYKWSRGGQCTKNKWMLENCRRSCNSCIDPSMLPQRCAQRFSRSPFLWSIGMK